MARMKLYSMSTLCSDDTRKFEYFTCFFISPIFAMPVAKPGGGFLTLISQCQHPFVLVTTLEEYRK